MGHSSIAATEIYAEKNMIAAVEAMAGVRQRRGWSASSSPGNGKGSAACRFWTGCFAIVGGGIKLNLAFESILAVGFLHLG